MRAINKDTDNVTFVTATGLKLTATERRKSP